MADILDDNYARLEQTAEIVAAYFANNHVRQEEVPQVIAAVYAAVSGLTAPAPVAASEPEPLTPAVPIKKSVTPDFLVSLEDGKQYKALKRHLAKLGMTPDQYRAKWGLPKDYPMVAASYAARRSELAKSIGLGRKAKAQSEE